MEEFEKRLSIIVAVYNVEDVASLEKMLEALKG